MNKKHVAIFGAGLAGCEFANDLVNANYRVTMIAPEVYPLSSLIPEAVGFALQDAFSKAGIDFHLTVFPQTVNHADNGYEITLSNGATVHADMIFSAVGIRPNTTLAQTAHLSINRGVMVSTYLQTNDPDIYALGDCAEVDGQLKMHIAAILHQARLLAEVVAGETPPIQHQITPIVIKTPLCPIVVEPPPTQLQGEWQVSGDGVNVKALFYDVDHHLRGFALAGSCVNERMSLVKALSA